MSERENMWPGWETVRLIGRGSFGSVYEIERDIFGVKEKAALKVITIPQNSSDIDELYGEGYDDASITSTFKSYLKSIVAEYSLMRKMNGSSNVVNCDDVRYVQHDDGFGWDIFIKMELLTPLTKALGKTVTDEQAVCIGADICKALVLCRKHDIIHRDIKPANIFVSENGDYKLGDFGIAKTVEKTSGGTKIGTYEYMAPEVYHGQPYGSCADIYSLGMVLYWLLNERRTPFLPLPPTLPTSSEKEQARKRRFSGEALPAPAYGSAELQRIVLKACAYDPKDRYQTADEMLRDLNALGVEKRHAALNSLPPEAAEEEATVGVWKTHTDEPPTVVSRETGMWDSPTEAHPRDAVQAEEQTAGAWGQNGKTYFAAGRTPQGNKRKKTLVIAAAAVAVLLVLLVTVLTSSSAKKNNSSSYSAAPTEPASALSKPTAAPTAEPTTVPTAAPTATPTVEPTSAPTATPVPKPSKADLYGASAKLAYPEYDSWLDTYETRYVRSTKGGGIYLCYKPGEDAFCLLEDGTKVTVLADQRRNSLVITEDGEIGWCLKAKLVSE